MLVCKGTSAWFELQDGTRVKAPGAMLHDPDGKDWGACSFLFVNFRRNVRTAKPEEVSRAHRQYLGKTHKARVGSVELPPRSLSDWERVGKVKTIWYDRAGKIAPGRYFHPFGKRTATFLWQGGTFPTLYKRGRAMRLELGRNCLVDDRGFCLP
jgi:hypothetical protein